MLPPPCHQPSKKRYPDVRIASFADDAHLKYTAITNMAHRPEVLYEG